IEFAQRLRRDGLAVICDVGRRSLKGKMRAAERSGAGAVGLLGENEAKAQQVTLRRLSTGEQVAVRLEEASAQVREWAQAADREMGQ
ncbi:MAG: His/Gly/Thr/Pro-type tRNA ligase C-terminal domain-containing protein, partial [Candidatus Dormiibacterota bacterium]